MLLPVRVLSVLLLVFPATVFAGSASHLLNFEHFTTRDGLPQTQVRAIHQDEKGYLWVGTYGGVGRYNGRDFRNFSTLDGLAGNTIEAVSSTTDGRVWVGTTKGLCFKTPGNAQMLNGSVFSCLEQAELATAHIQALLPDHAGGLWIGTTSGLFRLHADGSLDEIRLPDNSQADATALAHASAHALASKARAAAEKADPAAEPGLWIGTRAGLYFRAAGGYMEKIDLPVSSGGIVTSLSSSGENLWIGTVAGLYHMRDNRILLAKNLPPDWAVDDVNAIAHDADGTVWAATDQGVLLQEEEKFSLLTPDNGLKSEIIFTTFVDREGVVWIGHDDGLSKYTPGPFTGYTQANGLLHYFVRTINEDSKGRLWLGTRNGAQIVPFRDGEWRFNESRSITEKDGLSDTRVYAIEFPAPGEAWLATGNGVVLWREGEGIIRKYDIDDGLPDSATQALLLHEGALWIGSNRGVRILRDGQIGLPRSEELSKAYVFRIRKDSIGRLWFGSQDRGVFMLDLDGTIRQFGRAEGLTHESIWDIAADHDGGVWIGSNGDGLFHVGENGEIKAYTSKDGLVDDFVWQVLVDGEGNVWSYTNRGISRFDGETFRNFGLEDGLLHLEGGATGAWESHDGSLWFASADGLMRYEERREFTYDIPPVVIIEEVTHGEQAIYNDASLAHTGNPINFRYAALSFQAEEQLLYKYRLRGANDNWSTPEKYQPVTYANLGGGQYVFEVLARNPDGEWSGSPARFRFSIAPAYWETAWFWLLVATAAALLLWSAFRLRIRQIESHRHELESLVASRTEELERANSKLQAASVTDPLTGLHNRRFLSTQIHTDLAQTRRAYRGKGDFPNRDIVFMMVDIDFFKGINDTYGHNAGDRVLRQYAELLNNLMRESDYTVRWGGEEFLIVARQTEASQAHVIAQRVMRAMRDARFIINENGATVACTCSVGVSHFPFMRDNPDAVNWEQVIDISDIAVYMAKSLGRDGWVSIQGSRNLNAADASTVLERIRTDLRGLVEDGMIELQSSYDDPLAATPKK